MLLFLLVFVSGVEVNENVVFKSIFIVNVYLSVR